MEQPEERQDVQNEILLTSEDVAEVFNVDVSTVEGWVIRKLLSAIHIAPQGNLRFREDDIFEFVNQHAQEWVSPIKLDN